MRGGEPMTMPLYITLYSCGTHFCTVTHKALTIHRLLPPYCSEPSVVEEGGSGSKETPFKYEAVRINEDLQCFGKTI